MKQIIISIAVLLCVVFAGCEDPHPQKKAPAPIVEQEKPKLNLSAFRYYSDKGKLICEEQCGHNGGQLICMKDGRKVAPKCSDRKLDELVYINSGDIPAKFTEGYRVLEREFVDEAVRQYNSHVLTTDQYVSAFRAARRVNQTCKSNGCQLQDIVKRRDALVDSFKHEPSTWLLRKGYIQINTVTPVQAKRLKSYPKAEKNKLQLFREDFDAECLRQTLDAMGYFEKSHKLLEIVIKAYSLKMRNLNAEERQGLLDAWLSNCGKSNEDPADSTTRFLLSHVKSEENKWGGRKWVCSDVTTLRNINSCGTITFWHDAGNRFEITSQFREVVPVLPGMKSVKH